jgi:hypothetical protein
VRLLILACSATKRPDAGLLPALERYDGPSWRTLRAYLRTGAGTDALEVYALSAALGLVRATTPIPRYDCLLNAPRALELSPQVAAALEGLGSFEATMVWGGRRYQRLLPDTPFRLGRVARSRGGIGVQLGQLRAWLRQA